MDNLILRYHDMSVGLLLLVHITETAALWLFRVTAFDKLNERVPFLARSLSFLARASGEDLGDTHLESPSNTVGEKLVIKRQLAGFGPQ